MEDAKDAIRLCLFCVEEINSTETYWTDIVNSTVVHQWIQEMYAIEINPPEQVECICRKCFIVILNDYEALTERKLNESAAQKK